MEKRFELTVSYVLESKCCHFFSFFLSSIFLSLFLDTKNIFLVKA
uniref:Uncharacterized protein n=1 Tax=Solanum lycopersicum TaxID=4081 RepID=K4CYM8_SOLLC